LKSARLLGAGVGSSGEKEEMRKKNLDKSYQAVVLANVGNHRI